MYNRLDRLATILGKILMKLCSIAVVIMMLAIIVQVIVSRVGVTTVVTLPGDWPLFGQSITLNSLTDLQWYLLAFTALIPAGVVWLREGHVRVDFAYEAMGPRSKAAIDIIGLVVFALPFLIYMIPDAWDMVVKSFARGEGSANGGLQDRYLVRSILPISLVLLLAATIFEVWGLLIKWVRKDV